MGAELAKLVRFVEAWSRSTLQVELLAKIPMAAHQRVLAVSERFNLHPMRIYRDAFDAGLHSVLEELAKHEEL